MPGSRQDSITSSWGSVSRFFVNLTIPLHPLVGPLDATPLISQRVAFSVPAGILPDNSEQLDPRHPVQVWRAAPGDRVLLAVPHDRYRAAAGACRHSDAREVLRPFGSQCARCCPQPGVKAHAQTGTPRDTISHREQVREGVASGHSAIRPRPQPRPRAATRQADWTRGRLAMKSSTSTIRRRDRMSEKPLKVIAGAPDRPLRIGTIEIECYVLEDETRVLSRGGFQVALGHHRTSRRHQPPDVVNLPAFLAAGNLNDFISNESATAP